MTRMLKRSAIYLFSLIGALAISFASSSCALWEKREFGYAHFITDAGTIEDRSFNENSYAGTVKGADEIHQTYGFTQPANTANQTLIQTYKTAIDYGSKILVLSGFNHASALAEFAPESPDTAFVGVDMDKTTFPPDGRENFFPVTFKAEQSGFAAGVATSYWLNMKNNKTPDEAKYKVGTFGGETLVTVTVYMNGFLQGLKWFQNNYTGGDQNSGKDYQPLSLVHASGEDFASDFSHSFVPGGGTAVSKGLIQNGAQVVFPVAGAQGSDTIGASKELTGGKTKIIGGDVDQSVLYDPTMVIGSAVKGLTAGTAGAIKIANEFIRDKKSVDAAERNKFNNVANQEKDQLFVASGTPEVDAQLVGFIYGSSEDSKNTFAENEWTAIATAAEKYVEDANKDVNNAQVYPTCKNGWIPSGAEIDQLPECK